MLEEKYGAKVYSIITEKDENSDRQNPQQSCLFCIEKKCRATPGTCPYTLKYTLYAQGFLIILL